MVCGSQARAAPASSPQSGPAAEDGRTVSLGIGAVRPWMRPELWRGLAISDSGQRDRQRFEREEDPLLQSAGAVLVPESCASSRQEGGGPGQRDGEQLGPGRVPCRVGPEAGGDQDGADRHADERDEGQRQLGDPAAVYGLPLQVVGEEREQPRSDPQTTSRAGPLRARASGHVMRNKARAMARE